MRTSQRPLIATLLALLPALIACAALSSRTAAAQEAQPGAGRDKPDLAALQRIKDEAFRGSKVMEELFWLTDANGPRLTNSPGFFHAANWAVAELQRFGIKDARLEKWGTFGRGWSAQAFELTLQSPTVAPLQGVPKAWSGPTSGRVGGELVLAPLFSISEKGERRDLPKLRAAIERYMAQHRGKLRGKVVLFDHERELELPKDAGPARLAGPKLEELTSVTPGEPMPTYQWPLAALPEDPRERRALMQNLPLEVLADYWTRMRKAYDPLWRFLRSEGALAVLTTDERGEGGLVFAESAGGWEVGSPTPPPVIALEPEAYNRLVRLVRHGLAPTVAVRLDAQFQDRDTAGYNVIGELPGHGRKDEVVMIGAHLDSWHAGTGATDNGAGSAVMLEAMRILSKLGLKMDRTVRIGLWSGEEQGLYGSRGYVRAHFADPVTMKVKPEHEKLAGYFNLDNGSGKVRGIYLQGNDQVRPIFEQWLAPFRDFGASTISYRNTGGTDHLSFDEVGLPGFQFIQDPLDYMSRTHHSAMDVYERAQPADLRQAAAIVAWFVYNTANRKELLPRKPMPEAPPPRTLP